MSLEQTNVFKIFVRGGLKWWVEIIEMYFLDLILPDIS